MNAGDLMLDGNAAGGLLNEIFALEMTNALATCAGCETTKPIAEFMLYRHDMGSVLRCAGCDTALLRITHIRGSYRLDLVGVNSLRIADDIH
jgi:hypothetical protein